MYAVIKAGGKQHKVKTGDVIQIEHVAGGSGDQITFEPILVVDDDGKTHVGKELGKALVTGTVMGERKGEKIRIGKYRAKSGYRKHTGFRAHLTKVQIESIGKRSAGATRKTAAAKPAATDVPAAPKGLPSGYAELTVAEVSEGAKSWNRPMLSAALAYEQENAKRKGALSALESALAAKEDH
jgi:large subunit ribosomal protein L21